MDGLNFRISEKYCMMIGIIGNNLWDYFFNYCAKHAMPMEEAKKKIVFKYLGSDYEVWEVSHDIYYEMKQQSQEDFIKQAKTEDAWWR